MAIFFLWSWEWEVRSSMTVSTSVGESCRARCSLAAAASLLRPAAATTLGRNLSLTRLTW